VAKYSPLVWGPKTRLTIKIYTPVTPVSNHSSPQKIRPCSFRFDLKNSIQGTKSTSISCSKIARVAMDGSRKCCDKLPFCLFVYITTQSCNNILISYLFFMPSFRPMRILLDTAGQFEFVVLLCKQYGRKCRESK